MGGEAEPTSSALLQRLFENRFLRTASTSDGGLFLVRELDGHLG